MGLSQSFPVPMTSIQGHPNKAKEIPQKHYKGAESDSDVDPPLKRRRLHIELPGYAFDPSKPDCALTRSKRAVSCPAVPSPQSIRVQHSVMAGQRSLQSTIRSSVNNTSFSVIPPEGGNKNDSGEDHGGESSPLKDAGTSNYSGSVRQSHSNPSSSLQNNIYHSACKTDVVLAMFDSQESEQSAPESVDMVATSPPASIERQVSLNKPNAFENDIASKESAFSPTDGFRGRQSISFGFDGSSDEPRPLSRPRSSTVSTRSVPSASSAHLQRIGPADEIIAQKITRIVFMIKHKKVYSAFVDREKFNALPLPAFTAENQHTTSENDIGEANNYPSEKKLRLGKAAAATASQNATSPNEAVGNSQGVSFQKPVLKRKRTSASTRQSAELDTEASVNSTPSEFLVDQKSERDNAVLLPRSGVSIEGGKTPLRSEPATATSIESVGGKTIFAPQSSALTDTGAMGGKTIFLPPAPPYRKKKASQSNSSYRKVSNGKTEGLESVVTPPKAQSKPKINIVYQKGTDVVPKETGTIGARQKEQSLPKRNSISTNQNTATSEEPEVTELSLKMHSKQKEGSSASKRRRTISKESEKAGEPPNAQVPRKRESVSSRELKELFDPYKSSTGIDTSLEASFEDESKKTRSSRNSNPAYAVHQVPNTGIGSLGGGHSEPKDTANMIRRKAGASRMEPMFPNLFAATKDATNLQVDDSTLELVSEAIQGKKKLSASSSENVSNNTMLLPSSTKCSQPVTEVTNPSIDSGNATHNGPKVAEDDGMQDNLLANKPNDLSSQATPLGQGSRSYSIDSEGKKIPTSRKDSLTDEVQFPPSLVGREPLTPTPQHAAATSLVPTRQSSLSQLMFETPEMATAPRRKRPVGSSSVPARGAFLSQSVSEIPSALTAPRGKLPGTLPPQQNGEISKREFRKSIAAPPQSPKLSILETSTSETPAPFAANLAPIKTPALQSSTRNKRSAAEISTPPMDTGATSTRLWKPTTMCDGSVLGYGSGEAWPGTSIDAVSKNVCRTIKAEREGVFRASGVLLGVRFVVGLV